MKTAKPKHHFKSICTARDLINFYLMDVLCVFHHFPKKKKRHPTTAPALLTATATTDASRLQRDVFFRLDTLLFGKYLPTSIQADIVQLSSGGGSSFTLMG